MSVNMKQSGALVPIASLTKAIIPLGFADCYSTEERQVGCWIDGKPLYQITYSVTFNSDQYDITISAEADIKNISGGVDSANKDSFIHIGYGGGSSDAVQAFRASSTILRFQNKYYSSRPNGEVTIQYTKTTDAAGSGIWTPDGTPAHHYSLTEHIVGTWYDGSTLYEKTLVIPFSSFTALSSGWRYIYTYKGTNEDVKRIEGYAESASYGHCMIGVRNYEANNTTSNYYWELDNYYNTLNLNFVGNSASVINPTYVYITYQYTKTS